MTVEINKNNFFMVTYNISISEDLAQVVDKEIKDKKFASRSEFFRDLIRRHCGQIYQKSVVMDRDKSDYYKLLEHTMSDWLNDENDGLFVTPDDK